MKKSDYIGAYADAETTDLLRQLAEKHDSNKSLTLRLLIRDAAQRAGIRAGNREVADKLCTTVQ